MPDPDDPWEAAQEGAELLALERQPRNEYAYFFLGSAYYEKEQYPQAMRAYVEALSIAPEYLGAMAHLGHTLRMLGRYGEAIRMGKQIPGALHRQQPRGRGDAGSRRHARDARGTRHRDQLRPLPAHIPISASWRRPLASGFLKGTGYTPLKQASQ
jgi:tetratricopeptide (TPR) repeat protein